MGTKYTLQKDIKFEIVFFFIIILEIQGKTISLGFGFEVSSNNIITFLQLTF